MEMRHRVAVVLSTLLLVPAIGAPLLPAAAQLVPVTPEPAPPLPPPPPPPPPSVEEEAQPEPDPAPEAEPRPVVVIDAFAYNRKAKAKKPSGTPAEIDALHAAAALEDARTKGEYKRIELTGLLAVRVSDAEALLGEGYERCDEVRLVFDREIFEEIVPYRCTADLVVYNLKLIDRGEEPAWQNLVRKRRGTSAYARISLRGPDGGDPLASETTDREIRLYNSDYGWGAGIGFAIVLVLFFVLARKSNLIRDGGAKRSPGKPMRPFSLARVQTAWWFFLVLFAFLFISLIEGILTPIPNSILGLMGIAGGTFLGAELVDFSRRKRKDGTERHAVASKETLGFFNDIFSDDGGVAFHRFQMAVWTLTLGIIFVIRVVRNLEMPEFETSILGLMGISSGTYLGMKIPETPKGEGKQDEGDDEGAGEGDGGAAAGRVTPQGPVV